MIKQNIVDNVSANTGLTKVEVEAVLNESFSQIINALSKNDRIELRGFGTFAVRHRMPKKARNPATGDPVYLPERYVPVFKPSKVMKKTINDKLIEY
ncbi:MAG: HU family DNA-binding protein [Candidatus Neomarinimicrobiota bacterium]|nr:HU family DNA-binding protein [Candidatus Neomarinimicrobiota bacterium]